jgi:transcriptional regulator
MPSKQEIYRGIHAGASGRIVLTAVAELRGAGLTVRDVAHLLGVTASRVSQIEQAQR